MTYFNTLLCSCFPTKSKYTFIYKLVMSGSRGPAAECRHDDGASVSMRRCQSEDLRSGKRSIRDSPCGLGRRTSRHRQIDPAPAMCVNFMDKVSDQNWSNGPYIDQTLLSSESQIT